jgi:septum formation protein
MTLPEVVLASGSPRRRQLLGEMGIRFRVAPTEADETLPPGAPPEEAALVLAGRKAEAAAARDPGALVIAADTLVAVDGRILGKPRDGAEAVGMLKLLRGREHEVVTGLCVAYRGGFHRHCERTWVRFGGMTDREIEQYVSTGEPLDKAGAYGIQGRAGEFIAGIDGCYFNVMGLPKAALRRLLTDAVGEAGYGALAPW